MTIKIEKKHHAAILTLNRPEVRNALSTRMLIDIKQALVELSQDKQVRCVIITGQGDKTFCAGADLKERALMSELQILDFLQNIQALFFTLVNFSKPTISAINADAFGGGLELALSTDIRVSHPKSVLGLTEVSLGILPCAGGTQRLPKIIGEAKALDMILLAKKITGQQAFDMGLVNYLAAEGEVLSYCVNLAEKIAQNSPLGVSLAKRAILAGSDICLEKGLKIELNCYKQLLFSNDRKEGLKSFAEKRPARFEGN